MLILMLNLTSKFGKKEFMSQIPLNLELKNSVLEF